MKNPFKDCEGCAERREKIKATMQAIADWARDPAHNPNPLRRSLPTVQTSAPRPRPKPIPKQNQGR